MCTKTNTFESGDGRRWTEKKVREDVQRLGQKSDMLVKRLDASPLIGADRFLRNAGPGSQLALSEAAPPPRDFETPGFECHHFLEMGRSTSPVSSSPPPRGSSLVRSSGTSPIQPRFT